MDKTMEKEYKWRADEKLLGQALLWASSRIGSQSRTINMESSYFDTADGALSAHRWTLRLRLEGGRPVVCLKTPAPGGARGEWEWPGSSLPDAVPAAPADWDTEYGDYILAVKVVEGLDEAIAHITAHSSGHSECIVTSDYFASTRFMNEIDAAAVYVNASTRFTDGGEFGLGAEIGISTQKLHARGPMGLEQLTSSKFLVYGTGQVR